MQKQWQSNGDKYMKQKEHHFCIEDAEKYGVEKAILIYNLDFWLNKNKANKKNIKVKDGKEYYWTFNSASAFKVLFPYLKEGSIARWLKELEEEGVIISDSFNKKKYDRTKWYTLKEYEIKKTISQNGEWTSQNEAPIPDIKPDNKHILPPKVEVDNKFIFKVSYLWKELVSKYLETPEKEVFVKNIFFTIKALYLREQFNYDDFKGLFNYFLEDKGVKRTDKMSFNLAMSGTYVSKYKIFKKSKDKPISNAQIAESMRL